MRIGGIGAVLLRTASNPVHQRSDTRAASLGSGKRDGDAMGDFTIIGPIADIETIASSSSIRDIADLRELYGPGNWRKRKGIATVRLSNGTMRDAEVHWYEANGIGRKKEKIKRFLEL